MSRLPNADRQGALEAAGDFDDPDDQPAFDRLYPAPKRDTPGAENRC